MSESVRNENAMTPMLFPFNPDQFWQRVRLIIREELLVKEKSDSPELVYETSGSGFFMLAPLSGSLRDGKHLMAQPPSPTNVRTLILLKRQ